MTTPNSFSGKAQATTLTNTSGIGSGDTSFTVGSVSTWKETIGANVGQPLGYSGAFIVTLDYGTSSEERILCSGISGLTVNVLQRGYDGTTAIAHSFGATAVHTISTDVPYNANLGVTNAATALSTANTAQTAANTAQTTANTANTTANTANTTANAALARAGGTMTGALILAADPTTNLGAATKQYVDAGSKPRIWDATNSITGISGYTNYLVIGTGTYSNPVGANTNVTQYLTLGGTTPLGPASGYLPQSSNTSTNPTAVNLTSMVHYANSGTWNASLSATDTPSASVSYTYQQLIVIGLN